MKKTKSIALLVIFLISATSFADNNQLMHQSHEKLRQAQQEMEVIKKTDDLAERKRLLNEHTETMQEFSDLILQVERDPQRGDRGIIMSDVMFERVRYLEQMMQQLLANQSERAKSDDIQ